MPRESFKVEPVAMAYLYPDQRGPEWPCTPATLARAVRTMVNAASHPWNAFSILVRLSDGTSTTLRPKRAKR